jgi:dipeptidyl aminopeptidase/acylaminoacyl peptidase
MCAAARICILFIVIGTALHSTEEVAWGQARWSQGQFDDQFRRAQIHPRWLPDEAGVWYAKDDPSGRTTYVKVIAETGAKTTDTNPARLGLSVRDETRTSTLVKSSETRSQPAGPPCSLTFVNQLSTSVELFWVNESGARVRYSTIAPGGEYRSSTFSRHLWEIVDSKGASLALVFADPQLKKLLIDGKSSDPKSRPKEQKSSKSDDGTSPNQRWRAILQSREIALRDLKNPKKEKAVRLSAKIPEGAEFYGDIAWAPRSDAFVVSATVPVRTRQLTLKPRNAAEGNSSQSITFGYAKPGDPLPQPVPVLFRLRDGAFQPVVIDSSTFPQQFITSFSHQYRWAEDGREFYFDVNDRGHQRYRILAVNRQSGDVRPVVDETSKTFVDYVHKTWRHWLPGSKELLWLSERSGWCHLWAIDVAGKKSPRQITTGNWVVRDVLHVDPKSETIWFLAGGVRATEDPYHTHLCRVQFDGSEFRQLTEGDGVHAVEFSPERQLFLDTWSRVDQPPVVELRRSSNGTLVTTLERIDDSAFASCGYVPPERFTATGRDGKTSIHGVLIKPSHFDRSRKYPVVENVYAGPHGAFTPRTFGSHSMLQSIAEKGFIVVQADGMGTNYRSKAFQDVCWKNLKDSGFPDRIAWIKAAAATRPWMDLSRVGIFGGSAGGQTAMRALLDHGDFYRVAVADCGCHDNRVDKLWWNEQWMGWPIDASYSKSSNVDDAAKLRGELLLIVGEMDQNVDPACTYEVAEALTRAQKPFELKTIPNTGHGAAETPQGSRSREEFLIRHLQPSKSP